MSRALEWGLKYRREERGDTKGGAGLRWQGVRKGVQPLVPQTSDPSSMTRLAVSKHSNVLGAAD